jgi:hypothetical protein
VHFCYHVAYLVITLCILFISYTCWVTTISVLNLTISPCYTNMLLRRWRWTGILLRGVLGLRYPGCCSCGVMESSVVPFRKRAILVFRDNIYVINILYSWHLALCGHFWSVCVESMILGTHAMSTWFCLQNWVWQLGWVCWYSKWSIHEVTTKQNDLRLCLEVITSLSMFFVRT